MSLYYESAALIKTLDGSQDTSLKSLLFSKAKPGSDAPRKSNPAQLYALITEAWKWSSLLTEVIERARLLAQEKKLTPQLALVLVHDLLLAKKGIAAPENHVLRQAVERHQTRIRAEFTKARVRAGCASVEELKGRLDRPNTEAEAAIESIQNANRKWPHPRWLRINTLRAPQDFLEGDEFRKWKPVGSLGEVLSSEGSPAETGRIVYYIDEHIPNLLALPPGTDLSMISAYKKGELISQDKASCFPAYLLSSGRFLQGDILDACAAPGNKTSHIAAIVFEQNRHASSQSSIPRVFAVERDVQRANTLREMLGIAGANHVKVHASQDFLKLDVNQAPWNNISAVILDPSCSGSGIVDRGQVMTFKLPSVAAASSTNGNGKSKKRKRYEKKNVPETVTDDKQDGVLVKEQDVEVNEDNAIKLETRLKSLAVLQTRMLTFAFSFPNVHKVTYSTCSVHDIENEGVVVAALASQVARSRGWRVMKRDEQVPGIRLWKHRGKEAACQLAIAAHGIVDANTDEVAEACVRCEPFTDEGTQGFFVAGFVRDGKKNDQPEEVSNGDIDEEQWLGFED